MLSHTIQKSISFLGNNNPFRILMIRFSSDTRSTMPISSNSNSSNLISPQLKSTMNKSIKAISKPLKKFSKNAISSSLIKEGGNEKKKPRSFHRKKSLSKGRKRVKRASLTSKGKKRKTRGRIIFKKRNSMKKGIKRSIIPKKRSPSIKGKKRITRKRISKGNTKRKSSFISSFPNKDTFYLFEVNGKKK